MPRAHIVKESKVERTPRVLQMEGLFDVQPSLTSKMEWEVNLPLEEKPWNIGLIVGPSGSGKTTIARELFGDKIVKEFEWDKEKSILDGFPKEASIKEITEWLSRVGFSSPPYWLRPYHVLSMGQQFRVNIARAMLEMKELIVFDEFTSVIDRQIAQIGSAAIAKGIRKEKRQFVAVACHYDIIDWLQPDWIYYVDSNQFTWREVRPHPNISLDIWRVDRKAWKLFCEYHYLSTDLMAACTAYCAFYEGRPAAFVAVSGFPHPTRPGWREHRLVCLPDFQGVGIGNKVSAAVGSIYKYGLIPGIMPKPYRSVTSAYGLIYARAKSKSWKMIRGPSILSKAGPTAKLQAQSINRMTASFEYIGATFPVYQVQDAIAPTGQGVESAPLAAKLFQFSNRMDPKTTAKKNLTKLLKKRQHL